MSTTVINYPTPQLVGNTLLKVLDSNRFTEEEKYALNITCHFAFALLTVLPREAVAPLIVQAHHNMQACLNEANKPLPDFKLPEGFGL